MNANKITYDVVIIGAGVSGAAQLYSLAKYSDVKRVLIIEKESAAGTINSSPTSNSQTLHEGDIETNYPLEKAKILREKSCFTRAYVEKKGDKNMYFKSPKMVLGVGSEECDFLRERFLSLKTLFPTLELLERDDLRKIEPHVLLSRHEDEEVISIYNTDGITINYQVLATSLISDARAIAEKDIQKEYAIEFDTTIDSIERDGDFYILHIQGKEIRARFVSVCTGAHSMYFAKQLKIESVKDLTLLLVAGNFYFTPKYITSKIYTVQNPKLPFSAVHGDPDILDTERTHTRFGPTTRVVFMLERHNYTTVLDFIKIFTPVFKTLLSYARTLFNKEFFFYGLKNNALFQIPFLGNYLFAKEVRKIIPSIKASEVSLAKGHGGVRPQIMHTNRKDPLSLGEIKLEDDHILFNVTPSPGASTCIYNGLIDTKKISEILTCSFDDDSVQNDFGSSIK